MIKVAVLTAYKYTSLEPYFIYDGTGNELVTWLEERNVRIIPHRSSIYDKLVYDPPSEVLKQKTARGAFLRVDIPVLAHDLGWDDQVVFYTDIDVMFTGKVILDDVKCELFAVGPESDINDFVNMNTGAMLMNIPALYQTYEKFLDFIIENYKLFFTYDQTAYKTYYHLEWDRLDPIYNWKPYWGKNPRARIIHFHGPKPTEVDMVKAGKLGGLRGQLARGNYFKQVEIWEQHLASIDERFSFEYQDTHPVKRQTTIQTAEDQNILKTPSQAVCPSGKLESKDAVETLSPDKERIEDKDWRAIKGKLALDIIHDRGNPEKQFAMFKYLYIRGGGLSDSVLPGRDSIDLDSPEDLKNLGIRLHLSGNTVHAEAVFMQAYKITPNDPDLLVSIGKLYYDNKLYNEAFQYLKRATEINPKDKDALMGLALTLDKLDTLRFKS